MARGAALALDELLAARVPRRRVIRREVVRERVALLRQVPRAQHYLSVISMQVT